VAPSGLSRLSHPTTAERRVARGRGTSPPDSTSLRSPNRSGAWSAVLRNTRFRGPEEMMSTGSDMSEARLAHGVPGLPTSGTPFTVPRLHAAESPAPSPAPRPASQPAPRPHRAEEPSPHRSSPVSSQRHEPIRPRVATRGCPRQRPPCPARVHCRAEGSPSRVPEPCHGHGHRFEEGVARDFFHRSGLACEPPSVRRGCRTGRGMDCLNVGVNPR
jgi:hypothetical protein